MPTKRQYKERKAKGLCVVCGRPGAGGVHCQAHRKKGAEWFANVRQKQQAYTCEHVECQREFQGYGERRYCSRKCANKANNPAAKTKKAWKKRHEYLPTHWRKISATTEEERKVKEFMKTHKITKCPPSGSKELVERGNRLEKLRQELRTKG